MAVFKIWKVDERLDKTIAYVKDQNKTADPGIVEDDALRQVLSYAEDETKTDERFFVSGINCDADEAIEEFVETKKHYRKTDGIQAYHAVLSFKPGEITPQQCHAIGMEFAQRAWGGRYQVVVTTHLNAKHLHCHFIVNSVSLVDGKRMHDEKGWVVQRKLVDEICREHGLSVGENADRKHQKGYSRGDNPVNMERIYEQLRSVMDEAISHSRTVEELGWVLSQMGYRFRHAENRKYWTIIPKDGEKPIRLYRLGDAYTNDAIINRVRENRFKSGFRPYQPIKNVSAGRSRVQDPATVFLKGMHLYRMYLYYCYRLGVFPRQTSKKPLVNPYMAKYVMKNTNISQTLDDAEYLAAHEIKTDVELQARVDQLKPIIKEN